MAIFSDYHMHPQGHRHQPYTQELLQPWADSCRSKGISDFAVTDHDRYHPGIDFDQIDRVRERNPDLRIRAGVELDNDPVNSKAGRAWVERHWDRLDFVLGSVHFLGDWAFDHAGQEAEFVRRDIDQVYEAYLHGLDRMIALGHIDCLAHLDLVKIFGFRPARPMAEVFGPILAKIKAAGLAMEISTAGWRKPVGEQYPDRGIVAEALALGIPITLASDAHSYVQVGENYERLASFVKEMGLKEVAVFEKHRRTMLPLTFESNPQLQKNLS